MQVHLEQLAVALPRQKFELDAVAASDQGCAKNRPAFLAGYLLMVISGLLLTPFLALELAKLLRRPMGWLGGCGDDRDTAGCDGEEEAG